VGRLKERVKEGVKEGVKEEGRERKVSPIIILL
jgi:hypothetical protein